MSLVTFDLLLYFQCSRVCIVTESRGTCLTLSHHRMMAVESQELVDDSTWLETSHQETVDFGVIVCNDSRGIANVDIGVHCKDLSMFFLVRSPCTSVVEWIPGVFVPLKVGQL